MDDRTAAAFALSERITATQERRTAIDCLRSLDALSRGVWPHDVPDPSEQRIAAFIGAARKEPRVVPSFDPEDT
jgi:hypothetical protein